MTSASPELPAQAEVVVIGGGVIGTSIAFHLAEAGVRDVVVVEKDDLGSGSTCKAAGGVRAQFSDELNIRLGARSIELFQRFPQRPGQVIDLHQVGYLFLLSSREHVTAFERNVDLQNSLGVRSRMLTVEEARRMSPLIEADGLLAAAFSPDDGHCTPESVVLGYATAARRFGARFRTRTAVRSILGTGSDSFRVETTRGTVSARKVVCAAGAWSREIGAMVGVDLPVSPLRRQIMFTEPMPELHDRVTPFTIDFGSTFYFHREGPGLLFGMSDPDETPGFKLDMSDAWLPRLTEAIGRRAPRLLDVGVRDGWAGLYEVTPDHNALIGSVGDFFYATGFSGHGFLQGPAVGEVVRDLVLGREPFVDVSALDASRFAADQARPELNCV
ncbi:NAD(P)/FAD-dependent oxidoreductase [Lentzea sp. NPDC058450]|uniref:NAD(P)/FAD-dependent oxidoreductase n=1 Tax=Lentzea sp. NPDC058450 TaxID=3346505 RepID=UPI00365C7B98